MPRETYVLTVRNLHRPPTQNGDAWKTAIVLGILVAIGAYAAGCLPLAEWHPANLASAVSLEFEQVRAGVRLEVPILDWPWQLSLPIVAMPVAGLIAMRFGYLHGWRRAIVYQTAQFIDEPKFFAGLFGR